MAQPFPPSVRLRPPVKACPLSDAVQKSEQCFCGTTLKKQIAVTASQLQLHLPGDRKQTCGGYGFLQAFQLNSVPTNVPVPHGHKRGVGDAHDCCARFGATPFEGVEVLY